MSVLRAEHDHGGDDDGSHGQAHAEGAVPPGQRVRTIEPFGDVTAVPCDDTGCTTDPSDHDTRRAWTVPGFDPGQVLAVRSGRRAFKVFIADSLDQDETGRILDLIEQQVRARS